MFDRLVKGVSRRGAAEPAKPNQDLHTDRLRAMLRDREHESAVVHAMLDTLPEALAMIGVGGTVMVMNKSAQDLFGSPEEFALSEVGRLARHFGQQVGPEDQLMPAQGTLSVHVGQGTYALKLATVTDSYGEMLGVLAILRDVTDQQPSQRLRNSLINSVTHELRTPLAAVRGAADVIVTVSDQSDTTTHMVDILTRNLDVLDRMITELLDLADLDAGVLFLRRDPVNLETLICQLVRGFLPEAQRAGLEILLMLRDVEHLNIIADETRLAWALGHLIRNGIHYTEPQGTIVVTAGIDRDQPDLIAIDVIDSGVGIRPEDAPKVFDRFFRGEAYAPNGRRLDPRGLGQGLYIVRTVTEFLGGRVEVHSTVGEGSAFTVRLPVAVQAAVEN
jgi:signal transduction histidine kinase